MQRFAPKVYRLDLGIANAYLLRGPEALVLIDTGGKNSAQKIARQLSKHKLDLKDISHILLTHGHWDHTGDLALIQELSGATVIAHEKEASLIRSGTALRPPVTSIPRIHRYFGSLFDGQIQPALVHQEVQDGESLDSLYPGLSCLHLPGHSPGHSGYYCEAEGWLIGGDVMMHVMPQLTLPLALFTLDPEQNRRSIFKVHQLGLRSLGLGHGRPILNTAQQATKSIIRRLSAERKV